MENVLYILGAGFSAPLGIPVMSQFIEKSKDMYAVDRATYEFGKVFTQLDSLSAIKNYMDSDLFNLEEVLSILEMQSHVSNGHTFQQARRTEPNCF